MNEKNCLKLADHLETDVVQEFFHMRSFISTKTVGNDYADASCIATVFESKCHTSACSLGHAPTIFPPLQNETWAAYSLRVFDIWEESIYWDFVFSERWGDRENTPEAAAKRLRFLVKHKPDFDDEEITDMQRGIKPLCYVDN